MKRFDEPGSRSVGGAERDTMEARIRELEAENADLRRKMEAMRSDVQSDLDALEWYRSSGDPTSEAEMLERVKTGPTISDVLAECARDFGYERR